MAAVLNCTVGHVVTNGACFLKRLLLMENPMNFRIPPPEDTIPRGI
jgi:hypothetical protein